MKQLAIIIPAYNASTSLNRLLSQIVGQCTDQVEVVVVDDGSSDDTLSVAQSYSGNGVVAVHQDNAGVSSARNRGIQECSAQYIWFVDADDYLKPGAISTLLAAIEQEHADCYLFGFEKRNGSNVTCEVNDGSRLYADQQQVSEHINEIFSQNLVNTLWNKVFKREIIATNSLHFEKMESGEDATFVLQYLAVSNSLYVVAQIVYGYVLHSDTSSSHVYHAQYADDESRMFSALQTYCHQTGAKAGSIYASWGKDLVIGLDINAYNGMGPRKNYAAFRRLVNEQRQRLSGMAKVNYYAMSRWCVRLMRNSVVGYCVLRMRSLLRHD
ncbi:glycosyltransferase family 2 protein [Bifidobacterium animalis]|uniref:glycosyltransferase family 2 protein n=1 Tax=Bifidobacterium animalis TaxID=28025 RepID=UPI003F91F329